MIRRIVHEVMHDRPAGFWGTLAKGPLRAASVFYGAGVSGWDWGYQTGGFRIHRFSCPVISIGNVTVGGTGKSPFLRFLIGSLIGRGERPVILTRGYGSRRPGASDETAEFQISFPAVPVYAGRNRLQKGKEALEKEHPTCFVLDDGFQHRRIHRDLNICLVDATDPFGNGFLLPRGILRERPEALRRADLLVLTHLEEERPDERFLRHLAALAPGVPVIYARHLAKGCFQNGRETVPWEMLKAQRPFVFSGIANPSSLDRTLQGLGIVPVAHERFLDHHPYTVRELEKLEEGAVRAGAKVLLTTGKDMARIRSLGYSFRTSLVVLEIEMELFGNERELTDRLASILSR